MVYVLSIEELYKELEKRGSFQHLISDEEIERRWKKQRLFGINRRNIYKRINGKLRYKIVMEKKLGRKLERGDLVHHKNNCKRDDRPENLELRTRKNHGSHKNLTKWNYVY